MSRIAVIGAGVTGLCAAFRARRQGHDVVVFEAEPRSGGPIATDRVDGFVVERGPSSIRGGPPEVRALLDALGLTERVVSASRDARHRYLLVDGRLAALPTSPMGLFRVPGLGPGAVARLLAEPLVPVGHDDEETVAAFFARRLGAVAADALGNPMIGGIFAGEPANLEMSSAMPRLWQAEQEEGSLVFGALRATSTAPRGSFTFPGGLAELIDTLSAAVGDGLRLSDPVHAVTREADDHGFRIEHRSGVTHVDEIVCTADPKVAARWFPIGGPTVPRAPVVAVHLGYRAEDVPNGLRGFGWLAHRDQRRDVLGCLWVSGTFPTHAPPGHHLVRVMIGGTRDPQAALLPDEAAVARAEDVLLQVQGIEATPVMVHVSRAVPGIPQYPPGFRRWLKSLGAVHGVRFAGWHYGGIGIADGIVAASR